MARRGVCKEERKKAECFLKMEQGKGAKTLDKPKRIATRREQLNCSI